jgi:3-deoxy-manno-octulosonate cytidylyltransferase (CMP-KDO synthetase)
LPGKALLEIAGKPMICWVVERALAARNVAGAIVATDDERIRDAVTAAGYEAVITRGNHRSGTDRIAEVAGSLEDADIIVNVQGDEPLISPETIDAAIEAIVEERNSEIREKGGGEREIGMVTTWEPMGSVADVVNPDVVKIVVADDARALYFSRSPVPFPRDALRRYGSIEAAILAEPALLANFRKHTGLYVFRREVLLAFAGWPQSELERLESLEQLRALEHGVKIRAIKASTPSIGVDTGADLERVRHMFEQEACSL